MANAGEDATASAAIDSIAVHPAGNASSSAGTESSKAWDSSAGLTESGSSAQPLDSDSAHNARLAGSGVGGDASSNEGSRTPSSAMPPPLPQSATADLPIANISRIMKRVLPENGKIAKNAKECMQECVSELISFITSEASDRCASEKRKTINGDDILYSLRVLGFDNYEQVLKVYLSRYRQEENPRQRRRRSSKRRSSATSTSFSGVEGDASAADAGGMVAGDTDDGQDDEADNAESDVVEGDG